MQERYRGSSKQCVTIRPQRAEFDLSALPCRLQSSFEKSEREREREIHLVFGKQAVICVSFEYKDACSHAFWNSQIACAFFVLSLSCLQGQVLVKLVFRSQRRHRSWQAMWHAFSLLTTCQRFHAACQTLLRGCTASGRAGEFSPRPWVC